MLAPQQSAMPQNLGPQTSTVSVPFEVDSDPDLTALLHAMKAKGEVGHTPTMAWYISRSENEDFAPGWANRLRSPFITTSHVDQL